MPLFFIRTNLSTGVCVSVPGDRTIRELLGEDPGSLCLWQRILSLSVPPAQSRRCSPPFIPHACPLPEATPTPPFLHKGLKTPKPFPDHFRSLNNCQMRLCGCTWSSTRPLALSRPRLCSSLRLEMTPPTQVPGTQSPRHILSQVGRPPPLFICHLAP